MPSLKEVQFIAMWRDCVINGYVDRSAAVAWGREKRTVLPAGYMVSAPYPNGPGRYWTLTPRGADLIATADAVGFDPDAIDGEPEPAACSECGGTKRVAVLGNFTNPCKTCATREVRCSGVDWSFKYLGPSKTLSDVWVTANNVYGVAIAPITDALIMREVARPVIDFDLNPPGLGED